MFSLLLVTAMSAVADNPNSAPPTARQFAPMAANRAFFPAADQMIDYSQSTSYYAPSTGFGCGCYCPSDDADLFLPCLPCAPCPINCFPLAPRGVTMRVNVYTPPPPIRICPPPPPRIKAPCL